MNTLLLSIVIGLVAGIIDIVPMIIQKLPRYSIIAAFLYFFFISIVIVHVDIPYIIWWLEGGLIALALMIPILIHVGATDKKPLPIVAANSIILGTLIGVTAHLLK